MTGRPNEVEQTGSGNNYVVALVAALFASITVVCALVDDPSTAVASLYVLPIAIVAVRWGTPWALAMAASAFGAYYAITVALDQEVGALGDAVRGLLFAGAALLVGGYSERVRRADRRNAERVSEVIETSHEAYVATDRDGVITAWNQAAEQIFGRPASEVLGRTVAETIVPPSLVEAHREGLRRLQASGTEASRVLGKRLELTALRADGKEFPIEITIAALRGDAETTYHAFLHDISERTEAAAEAERLKSEFFALVSHELKSPLTAVLGYQQLIAQSEAERLSERGRRYVELIGSSGEELNRRIGDLLLVAQVEAGTFTVELGRVDLGGIVRQSVEAAMPQAEQGRVSLSLEAAASAPAEGDQRRLGQVVDNLISNAIKFTPAEGSVTVRLGSRNGASAIEVTDTGIGIEASERKHLFDRFYRAKAARGEQIAGVGLGLSIVDAIVRAHGGGVEIESEPGRGSTFRVLLPASRDS